MKMTIDKSEEVNLPDGFYKIGEHDYIRIDGDDNHKITVMNNYICYFYNSFFLKGEEPTKISEGKWNELVSNLFSTIYLSLPEETRGELEDKNNE